MVANSKGLNQGSLTDLSCCIFVDAVVVHSTFIAHRYGPLARTALTLPHQEAAINAAAQQVLGSTARNSTMVPAELVQAVDWCHIIAWNPANQLCPFTLNIRPFTRFVVVKNNYLFT